MIAVPSEQQFIAGACGGVAQVLFGHPLDTIKTRLQILAYKSPLECFQRTIQNEGFLGLYKGIGPPLLGISFMNAVLFSACGMFKQILAEPNKQLSLERIAIAGGGAGFIYSFVASPIELVKIRLQANHNTRPISQVLRTGGMYRGLLPTILKEVPGYAGYYTGFEFTKRLLSDKDPSLWQLMVAGSVGGISYWTACYPLDVIKSRIQQSNGPSTIYTTVSTILKSQGWRGLFNGFSVSLVRSVPSAAATFTVYELVLNATWNFSFGNQMAS